MADFIVIPVLYFAYPISVALGLPAWHVAWTSYGIPAFGIMFMIWVWSSINEGKMKWYDPLIVALPGFIWMCVILNSSFQLAIAGLSFYGGATAAWVLLVRVWPTEKVLQHQWFIIAVATAISCFAPIACLALAQDGFLGQKLSIHHYFYGGFKAIW